MKRFVISLLAAIVAAAIWLPALGVPFDDVPEPLEALVVQEMAASGDWVLPRRNGTEIPSKPPLYHWVAIGFSTLAGGVSETTTRLPSTLFASLAVAAAAGFAFAEWGTVAAVASAVVLATAPEWSRWAVTARTDATFAFFVTAALLAADAWLKRGRAASLVLAAAAAGGAVLAKGPAGVALPLLVLMIEIPRRRAWHRLRAAPLAAAAGVFFAIAASWYLAALARGGLDFFQKQIVAENLLRFLPNDDGGPSRRHGPFFYFGALAVGLAPWTLALPAALRRAWSERPRAGTIGGRARDGAPGFLLVWLAVVFTVCTAASGKRSNYILPLYPAAALLVGREIAALLEGAGRGRARGLAAIGWSAVAVLAAFGAILLAWSAGAEPWRPVVGFLHPRDRELLPVVVAALGRPSMPVVLAVGAAAISLAVCTLRRRWHALAALLAGCCLGLTLLANAVLHPLESQLKTFEPFAERLAGRIGDGEPLRFFRKPQYAVIFYLRRHVPVEYGDFGQLPSPGWALIWEEDWGTLDESSRARGSVVDESPPAALNRENSRLFLVRLRESGHRTVETATEEAIPSSP